jgi:hypothetical protein
MNRIIDPNAPPTPPGADISRIMSEVLTKEYTVGLARVAAQLCGAPRVDVMTMLAIRNLMNDNRQLREELETLKRFVYGEEKISQKEGDQKSSAQSESQKISEIGKQENAVSSAP